MIILQMEIIENNNQHTVLYEILMCEYAASNRMEDMLAGIKCSGHSEFYSIRIFVPLQKSL
jgi:hypothetical protein